jgi:hypothetical protein
MRHTAVRGHALQFEGRACFPSAIPILKRNVSSKDLAGLSDDDAEKLAKELQARWDAEQEKR